MNAIRVGDLVVQPVYDGTALLTADMWSGADWTEHRHLLRDDDSMLVPVGGFLVRVGDHLVLLDAGVGDVHNDMFDGGRMLDSLYALGVAPSDIDTIVVSHLHSDHMGWLATMDGSTFPNATIHVGAADWEHFVEHGQGGERRVNLLRKVEAQMALIDTDGVTVVPGVTTRQTPGHTPGHTSTVLSSGEDRLIVLGDALHCPAQLTEPEWHFVFDVDADLAARTRAALVQEAEAPGTTLLPCHFPGMQAARLVPATGQRHWVITG
jgi:glyoxylase-like metal-dependent hydrolase (beta-lactamase superfamily II)